jgi:N-ethylmaleimide reductase
MAVQSRIGSVSCVNVSRPSFRSGALIESVCASHHRAKWGGISDSNPEATFSHVAKVLDAYKIAYLHIIEPRIKGDSTLHEGHPPVASKYLRPYFTGPIIAAGGFDREGAEAIVESGVADLVAFGRHFTSNPDLPYRLKHKLPLTPYVRDAFWGGDEHGYADFPALEPAAA